MVAWMNGHTDRYKAYVCHAGCFDWVAMFADDAWYWHPKELGACYWDDPAKVDGQNPRARAERMKTPTLVMHGLLDYRVPDAQGLAYYNTLKAKGVPARLVFFPDENHWILKPQNSRLWYREFFAWLERHDAGPPEAAASEDGARGGRGRRRGSRRPARSRRCAGRRTTWAGARARPSTGRPPRPPTKSASAAPTCQVGEGSHSTAQRGERRHRAQPQRDRRASTPLPDSSRMARPHSMPPRNDRITAE